MILKSTFGLCVALLLSACNTTNGEGKQNSDHSLVNSPPIPQEQNLTLKEDTQTEIILKATDPDNDTIGYRVSSKPKHGTLKGKAPHLTYTPNPDYNGRDTFTFIANDGAEDSKEATFTLNITPVADLKAIKLTVDKTTLKKETNISYALQTTLDKGEATKALQQKIELIQIISQPNDAIKVDTTNKTIQVLKDGNLTINAKADSIASGPVTLHVYWEVNGHRLPPEPDPKVNNSTLLGVDSNHNGIRDDVERWIYERYKNKHPIMIALAMDAAQAYQEALKSPTHYKKAHQMSSDYLDCKNYYSVSAQFIGEPTLLNEDDSYDLKNVFSAAINTKERIRAYLKYDESLSGGIYALPDAEEEKAKCSTRVKEVLK